jgi:hypothetical protein
VLTAFCRRGLPVWQQLIIDAYPSIYLDPNPEIWHTNEPLIASIDPKERVNLRYGFEMKGTGWIALIENISETAVQLVTALRSSGIQPDARIHSFIIKEKLGRLVWQGHNNLEEPFNRLFRAYCRLIGERSTFTCERCGRAGSLRTIDRLKITLCDREYELGMRRLAKRQAESDF